MIYQWNEQTFAYPHESVDDLLKRTMPKFDGINLKALREIRLPRKKKKALKKKEKLK